MVTLSTLKINRKGEVFSVTSPNHSTSSDLLPKIGSNLTNCWDAETNNSLRELVNKIFTSPYSIETTIKINDATIQLTAFEFTEGMALIHWKTLDTSVDQPPRNNKKLSDLYTEETEKQLSEKVNIYKELTDTLPIGVLVMHVFDDGRFEIVFTNKRVEDLNPHFDIKIVNENNQQFFSRVHPDDIEKVLMAVKNTFSTKVCDIVYRVIENGEIYWQRAYGISKDANIGNMITIYAYIQDITEHKKVEESLKKERTLLRTLIDTIPYSIFVKDEKGRKIIANKYDVEYMGLREEHEAIGKTDTEIYGEREGINWEEEDAYVLNTGNPIIDKPGNAFTNNGEKIDIQVNKIPLLDENGTVRGLVGICRDVTEKRKIQNQLKLVDFAFRHTATPMAFINKDGSFFDFNEATASLLGYTVEEYRSLTITDIYPSYNLDAWSSRWEDLIVGKNLILYTKLKKKNGALLDIEVRANIIHYGEIEINCAFYTDITEKKKIEERLKLVDFVFRNASTAIQIFREDATLYDFNETMPKLLGYSKEEYQNLSVFDIDPNRSKEGWSKVWDELKNKGSLLVTRKLIKKNNELINAEISANYVKYDDLELNCAFVKDITEKTRLEERLYLEDFIYRKTAIAIIIATKEAKIYDFNEAALELYGYTSEEMKGLKISDLVINDDSFQTRWDMVWEQLKKRKTLINTSPQIRKDKSILEVEIRANYIVYGDLELNCSFVIDVTDKKKTQEALNKSNERYEYATLATSDVIWESDLNENTYYLSKNFSTLFGHKSGLFQDSIENEWSKNVHPDDLPLALKNSDDAIKGNKDNWKNEYRFKKADGTYTIILDKGFVVKDENGKVIRLIGAMHDITMQKKEEERLKLIETVITNTTDAIVIKDANPLPSGSLPVLYVNEAFTQMTGYSFQEVEGKATRFLAGPLTNQEERRKLQYNIDNYLPGKMEIINYKKNGEPFWVNISIFPVADKNGKYTHWVSMQKEVTLRKKEEEEKETLIKELISNNKELKQFGYITTHNLRAPLTNLMTISKLLDENKIEDALSRKLIDGFKKSTILLNDTLNDLINVLFIKERTNIVTEELSLEEELKKVIASISNILLAKNVHIDYHFLDAPIVNFSDIYLESIFLNLLTNSIKYAHPDRNPVIKINSSKDIDGKVKLIFSDNGIGMNMDSVKNKIFGLYQRFHSNADSKGIGLYLVHSQITALGGNIEVNSEVNVGTTFKLTFERKQIK